MRAIVIINLQCLLLEAGAGDKGGRQELKMDEG